MSVYYIYCDTQTYVARHTKLWGKLYVLLAGSKIITQVVHKFITHVLFYIFNTQRNTFFFLLSLSDLGKSGLTSSASVCCSLPESPGSKLIIICPAWERKNFYTYCTHAHTRTHTFPFMFHSTRVPSLLLISRMASRNLLP